MIKGLYEAHLPVRNLEASIEFYQKLGMDIAFQNEKLVFFWIEQGRSWLGLWETDKVETPYHPSLRHIAFQVDHEEMKNAKGWLEAKGIKIRTAFGFTAEEQPVVLPNFPHAHASIYFYDPDGNSLELITPVDVGFRARFEMMSLREWNSKEK